MTERLTKEDIQLIRQIRIHKVLGMKDDGRRLSIRCPFHAERSPSFVLYTDNSYFCFGCGAHGSGAIDFVMGLGSNFNDAIELLAKYL